MNKKRREKILSVFLYIALIIVGMYILFLVKPSAIQNIIVTTKNTAKSVSENLVQTPFYRLLLKKEASDKTIFDQITPIVPYIKKQAQAADTPGQNAISRLSQQEPSFEPEQKENEMTENTENKESSEALKSEENKESSEALKSEENKESSEALKSEENKESSEALKSEENKENSETPKSEENKENSETLKSEEITETATQALMQSTAAAVSASNILPKMAQLTSCGQFSLEEIQDYNYLKSLFIVDSKTSLPPEILNPDVLLSKDLSLKENSTSPQILIYHTHSQEAFADSESGNTAQSIIGAGEYLTNILTETYGYYVIHHTETYDMTDGVLDREPAYTKSLPDLQKILQENPTIEVVIDLHRDGVQEDKHLVTNINGKPMAKIMFFNGLCRYGNEDRTDITNPYREDNLAFSLQMALTAKAYYPELLRVIYTRPGQYNQHLCKKSALIECGAQTNTVEEIMNTMPVLADIIHKVLNS